MDVKYFCRYCNQSYAMPDSAKSCEEKCKPGEGETGFLTGGYVQVKNKHALFEEVARDITRFGITEDLLEKDKDGRYRNMIVNHYFQFFCEGLKR